MLKKTKGKRYKLVKLNYEISHFLERKITLGTVQSNIVISLLFLANFNTTIIATMRRGGKGMVGFGGSLRSISYDREIFCVNIYLACSYFLVSLRFFFHSLDFVRVLQIFVTWRCAKFDNCWLQFHFHLPSYLLYWIILWNVSKARTMSWIKSASRNSN